MAKKMSNKKPLFGNRRSFSLNSTRHAQKPNLQKITVDGKQVRVSARELRTINNAK